MRRLVLIVAFALGLAPPAWAADRITFGTDWKAQAEHGGFYQALAAGLYARAGLAVTLRQGGPQVNHAQLLANRQLDFGMLPNSSLALNFVRDDVPVVTVAAYFQKDPSVLIAHPGQGHDSLASLKGRPVMISADTRTSWWLFLKAKFGYSDDQIRPYAFSVTPFLADKTAVQQGYLSSEPFVIERAGVQPVVHLVADAGYQSYGALVATSAKLVAERPDAVQRFLNASIEGWYDYLYRDASPANALIKRDNPEMTDELIAYGFAKLRQHGIGDSGDARQLGIGAMSAPRWQEFFELMAAQGLYPRGMDWRRAFVLDFVNRAHVSEKRR